MRMNAFLIAPWLLAGASCLAAPSDPVDPSDGSANPLAVPAEPTAESSISRREPDPSTYTVEPRRVSWTALRKTYFDPAWILPERRADGGRDLTVELRELLALELDLVHPEDQGRALRSFGDLAQAASEVDPRRRGAWLANALAVDPELERAWGPAIRQLLDDRVGLGDDWDPDEEDEADGLYLVEAWPLPKTSGPWRQVKTDVIAEQGALFVRSDITTFKEVENDYSAYDEHVAASYEEIGPAPGSHVFGVDENDRPFSSVRVDFCSDLPFPFGDYDCELRILNQIDANGQYVAHVYTTSGDFHWMAGRDAFLPVKTSAGEPIGCVVVRVYGFDLDGVPDGRSDRKTALRSSIGNLKRAAEARFRESGSVWRDPLEGLPEFAVLGSR